MKLIIGIHILSSLDNLGQLSFFVTHGKVAGAKSVPAVLLHGEAKSQETGEAPAAHRGSSERKSRLYYHKIVNRILLRFSYLVNWQKMIFEVFPQ